MIGRSCVFVGLFLCIHFSFPEMLKVFHIWYWVGWGGGGPTVLICRVGIILVSVEPVYILLYKKPKPVT
jgi:hypothetical protein